MSNKITIALLQHAAPPSEPRDSYLKSGEKMARRAQSQGSKIICIQEFSANSHCCHADVYGCATQFFLDGAK